MAGPRSSDSVPADMATIDTTLDDDDFDDREYVLRLIDRMLRRESLPDDLRDRILELRRDVFRMPIGRADPRPDPRPVLR